MMSFTRPRLAFSQKGWFFRLIPLWGLVLMLGVEHAQAQRPLGTDVSHYQLTINWTNVKNAGIAFAWAKATESDYYKDAYFTANVNWRQVRRHTHRRVSFCPTERPSQHHRRQQRRDRGRLLLGRRQQLRQVRRHLHGAHARLGRHRLLQGCRLHQRHYRVRLGQSMVQHRLQLRPRQRRRGPQAHRLHRRLDFPAQRHLPRPDHRRDDLARLDCRLPQPTPIPRPAAPAPASPGPPGRSGNTPTPTGPAGIPMSSTARWRNSRPRSSSAPTPARRSSPPPPPAALPTAAAASPCASRPTAPSP